MKKNTTIHILPELECGFSEEDFVKHLELAATIDYVPDSIKTLQRIDFYDLKYLMEYNDSFFDISVFPSLSSSHIASYMITASSQVIP